MQSFARLSPAVLLSLFLFAPAVSAVAQDAAAIAQPVVPHLVRYAGAMPSAPASASVVEAQFAVYVKQSGGDALWTEVQQVALDAQGKYSVLLGSVQPLPDSLFAAGEARWVGVTLSGQPEGARTALAASAYSLKASDSETVGGHPASDFVLAAKSADGKEAPTATAITQINTSNGLVGGGTGPTLNLSLSTSFLQSLGNSAYAQLNAANTLTGNQTINGNLTVNGTLAGSAVTGLLTAANGVYPQLAGNNTLSGTNTFTKPVTFASTQTFAGTATLAGTNAFTGTNSFSTPVGFAASQTFAGTATLAGNNAFTGTDSFSKAVTFASGQAFPGAATLAGTNAFTGSNSFSSAVTFASGQLFPGTLTGITAGTGITATASGQNVTVAVNPAALESTYNSLYAQLSGNNSLSGTNTFTKPITFASAQTFPGAASTSAGNTFTGNQTINGTLTATASAPSAAVEGVNTSTSGGAGVEGSGYTGVFGNSSQANGEGVWGSDLSGATGTGVYGAGNTTGGFGVTGNGFYGVLGGSESGTGGVGVYASGDTGVEASSTVGQGVYGTTSATGGPAGIYGNSSATTVGSDGFPGIGISGNASGPSSYGVYGSSTGTTGYGIYGNASTGTGVYGQSDSSSGTGVLGQAENGVAGNSTGTGYGVSGDTGANGSAGVVGTTESGLFGVQGVANTNDAGGQQGAGVVGSVGLSGGYFSTTGFDSFASGENIGVWGDQQDSTGAGEGVLATADSNTALLAANNSSNPTMEVSNDTTATHNIIFETESPGTYSGARHCTIDTSANITCTGLITGVTPSQGKQLAMYSVLSPENWLEDFGSGQLSHGSAHVSLEPMYGDAANAGVEYHVFLTPNDDCRGLYIAAKSADGFDVRELGGGRSSVSFDYRIVAKRKGYEQVRLEDLTEQQRMMQARMDERKQRAAANADRNLSRLHAAPARSAVPPVEHLAGPPKPTITAPAPIVPRKMPVINGAKVPSQIALRSSLQGEETQQR